MRIALLALAASLASLTPAFAADQPTAQSSPNQDSHGLAAIAASPDSLRLFAAKTPSPAPFTDTYFLNDHLGTTVASIDVHGIIDRMETDAFGAPLPEGRPAVRYTGKPWDDDINAYVFPFRNYRPEEARWMTPDPSGFPDGMNHQRYLANPLGQTDSLGLSYTAHYWPTGMSSVTDLQWNLTLKETVVALSGPDSSGYYHDNVQFNVDNLFTASDGYYESQGLPAPAPQLAQVVGYIVQEVQFIHWGHKISDPSVDYLEAWVLTLNETDDGLNILENYNSPCLETYGSDSFQLDPSTGIRVIRGWAKAFLVNDAEWIQSTLSYQALLATYGTDYSGGLLTYDILANGKPADWNRTGALYRAIQLTE